MSKIAILTFHNAYNYGAVLQAWALKNVIEGMGHNVKILNFKGIKDYNQDLKLNRTNKPKWYRLRTRIGWYSFLLECKRNQSDWNKRCKVFDEFIINQLLSGDCKELNNEELNNEDVDCFIIGSDQVWNEQLTKGIIKEYWGFINTKAKIITYGASRINSIFSEEQKGFILKAKANFKAISVREKKLAEELSKIWNDNKNVNIVVDPALLQKKEFYREKQVVVKQIEERKKPYLLLYYIDYTEEIYKCAEIMAEKYGYYIVDITFPKRKGKNKNIEYLNIPYLSPQEFLWCFDNSEFVVTSSYHGVIFSIIYEKPFYAIYDKDDRKDELLSLCGYENRHIRNITQIKRFDNCIDYSYKKVDVAILNSIKFLKENI